MTEPTIKPKAAKRAARRKSEGERRRHGLYSHTFTPHEMGYFDAPGSMHDERKMLRSKILRLAQLTPLKAINDKELDTLIKLIRVVAMLDVLERTELMRLKVDASA